MQQRVFLALIKFHFDNFGPVSDEPGGLLKSFREQILLDARPRFPGRAEEDPDLGPGESERLVDCSSGDAKTVSAGAVAAN